MGRAQEGDAWFTVMGNANAIAVAVLADTACLVLTEDSPLDDDARERALSQEVAVLGSGRNAFQLAAASVAVVGRRKGKRGGTLTWKRKSCLRPSTVYTAERYRKFGEFHLRSTVKWSRILLWLCAAFLAVFTTVMLVRGGLHPGYAALCYILAVAFVLLPWLIQWMTRRQIETAAQSAEGMTDRCEFYGDYFEETNDEGQTTAFYPRLWRAVETEDCFYLYLDRSTAAVVEKRKLFAGGCVFLPAISGGEAGGSSLPDVSAGV